ncbi:unnamed protein product [Bursaphelenchus okinawaensis]|uniref:EamA domain-containing protein n=1 Tax=Bursaphelenchus okinawaensis TaxID=465554 RepID=A0A811LF64_9BILA|nr:unnamed protein product [Bursaphelenchus okinawaensis]CAG9122012.1 unnamed protein product [Bursaphelenchus okinawaensis]
MASKGARNIILSVAITFFIASCTTVANQLAKNALTYDKEKFAAPFFMAWFGTLFMIPLYPIYFLIRKIFTKASMDEINGEAFEILEGKDGRIYKELVLGLGSFTFLILWTGPPYLFGVSVQFISVSAATGIGSLSAAMVFLFSIIFLGAEFSWFKAAGIAVSIAGVVLLSLDGNFTGSVLGVCLILLWAFITAVYNTAFKKVFGDLSLAQVLFYQSLLGLADFIWNTIPMLVLAFFDYDRIVWESIPWLPVIGNGIAGVAFAFGANLGIAMLNPLVVSIAFLVGIPMNAAVDIIFRGLDAGPLVYIGGVLIAIGFCFTSLPFDDWIRKLTGKKEKDAESDIKDSKDTKSSDLS